MVDKSPWRTIWTEPRATIRHIVGENPKRALWGLAAIYGFASLLNAFQSTSLGMMIGLLPLLVLGVVLAPLWGYVVFALWSWVVVLTGKLLKGQGNFQTIRAAYAWSCTPFTVTVALWILLMFLFGHSLFMHFPQEHLLNGAQTILLFCILLAKVVLAVWSLVIYLNALAEVQHFSILRAIGNVLISAVVIGVVFSAILGVSLRAMSAALGPPHTALELMQNLRHMI